MLTEQTAAMEQAAARMAEMEEEHGGEEGLFSELESLTRATVAARLREIRGDKGAKAEAEALAAWLDACTLESDLKSAVRQAEEALDELAYRKYPKLTEAEIRALVVEEKWLAALSRAIRSEIDRISQSLTRRVRELAERYETPLPAQVARVEELEKAVNVHLKKMGFSWA